MPALKNEKRELFAKLVVSRMKLGNAWRGAGYKAANDRQASRLGWSYKNKPDIAARIAELEVDARHDTLKSAMIDRQGVLCGLQEIIDMGTGVKPSGRDAKGRDIYKVNLTSAARARELQGKELGMFADRLIVNDIDKEIEGMSADDLHTYAVGVCTELGLRVVEMSDEQLRTFIVRNAGRVGLTVSGAGVDGAENAEDAGVPSVSEAAGVPPGRTH